MLHNTGGEELVLYGPIEQDEPTNSPFCIFHRAKVFKMDIVKPHHIFSHFTLTKAMNTTVGVAFNKLKGVRSDMVLFT